MSETPKPKSKFIQSRPGQVVTLTGIPGMGACEADIEVMSAAMRTEVTRERSLIEAQDAAERKASEIDFATGAADRANAWTRRVLGDCLLAVRGFSNVAETATGTALIEELMDFCPGGALTLALMTLQAHHVAPKQDLS